MIAIVIAAAQRFDVFGLDEHLPVPLYPLADRPFLHHVVDFLVANGIRRFEFVLGHLPEKIEAYLGDGTRWGASFGFHLLTSSSDPLELAQTIAEGIDDAIVLASADTLPEFELIGDFAKVCMDEAGDWTGWAMLPRAPHQVADLATPILGSSQNSRDPYDRVIAKCLSFRSARELLRSQRDILSGAFRGSEIIGRQIKPGIWVSRKVSLHPTVQLKAPLYIGSNCKIEMGVRIGPFAVIGEGSIVDQQSSVSNALVAPGTYIGQGLELEEAIAERNRLVNTKLETGLLISEEILLSGLSRLKRPRFLWRVASRLGALALFLMFLPIAGLTVLFFLLAGFGEFVWERAVDIPTSQDSHMWRECRYLRFRLLDSTMENLWTDFAGETWIGLIAVLKGDLFLAGVQPRPREEVDRLPADWRSLYLTSKAGLVTEAAVMFGRRPSRDEFYIAEAYYTAVKSVRHDFKLLRLYFLKLLTNTGRRTTDGVGATPSLEASLENVPEQ